MGDPVSGDSELDLDGVDVGDIGPQDIIAVFSPDDVCRLLLRYRSVKAGVRLALEGSA
jgi:hypothetical protein